MNLTIDHAGVRREVDGPLNISGDPDELRALAAEIMRQAGDVPGGARAWVSIEGGVSIFNTRPADWKEAVN